MGRDKEKDDPDNVPSLEALALKVTALERDMAWVIKSYEEIKAETRQTRELTMSVKEYVEKALKRMYKDFSRKIWAILASVLVTMLSIILSRFIVP